MLRRLLVGPLVAYLATLRFPLLFGITALVFVADMLVPDLIPFVDEILLGLATALFGSWKRRTSPASRDDASPRTGRPPTPPTR